jgi:hypothetical protein
MKVDLLLSSKLSDKNILSLISSKESLPGSLGTKNLANQEK